MKDKKNLFDQFLDKYDEISNKKKVDVVSYYRPGVGKCIFGFVFCFIFLIILCTIFNFSFMYFLIFIINLLCLLYFGMNLFTERGLPVRFKGQVNEEYFDNDEDEEEDEEDEESTK